MKNNKPVILFYFYVTLGISTMPFVWALEPFEVSYNIYKGPLKVGSITRILKIENDGSYVFQSRMKSSGLATFLSGSLLLETSHGRISDKKVIPESYIRETDKGKKNYTLVFDRKNNIVQRTDEESGYTADLKTDTYDKLSYQAQMMMELGEITAGGLSYNIASQKKMVKYNITRVKEKRISTPIGKFKTLAVNRKDPNSSKETTVYCAEQLNWLPVRIEHTDKKGRSMTAKLETYSSNNH